MGTRAKSNTNMGNQHFSIDTKGICFLCLRLKDNMRVNADVRVTTTIHSFQKLSRYLDLDFQRVFNISIPMLSSQALEETDLLVSLCNKCSLEANTFSQLYQEMEAIMSKANVCVKNMHRLMNQANRNPLLLQQYRDRMMTTNPLELVQASIAENFRKELMDKCSQKIQKEGLLKNNKRMPNLVQLQTNSPTTIVQLLPLPSGSCGIQETQASPSNSFNQVNNVECVVLGDSDEEKSDSPPGPELVISSVSGANGASYEELPSTDSKSASSSTQPVSQSNVLQEADSFLESLFSLPPSSTNAKDVSSDNWIYIGDGRAQCKICSKILTTGPQILRNHERIHSGDKPIQCIYCPQRFRNNTTLRFHFISNHRAELLSKFRSNAVQIEEFKKLVDHVVQEDCIKKLDTSGRPQYMCFYCSKHVRQKPDVEAHLIQYHFDNVGQKLTQIQNDPALFNKIISPNLPDFFHTPSSTTTNVTFNSDTTFGEILESSVLPLPTSLPTTPHTPLVDQFGLINSSSIISISPQNHLPSNSSPSLQVPNVSNSRTKPSKTTFRCQICSKYFSGIISLRKHRITAHTNPNSSSSGVTITPINNVAKRPKLNQVSPINTVAKRPKLNQVSPAPKSTLAHRRSQENADKKYSCPHCGSSFKFYSTHRIHLLNVHRFEILEKYLEKGTTLEEVNDVFNPLLKEWLPNGPHCKCRYCDRLFTPNEVDLSQLRNHMLLTHFNELVARLTKGLKEKKMQEDSKLLVPKFEEEMVSILPD